MNTSRRSFLGSILTLGVAPLILPSSTTYSRIWTPRREMIGFSYLSLKFPPFSLKFHPIYNQKHFEEVRRTGDYQYLIRLIEGPHEGICEDDSSQRKQSVITVQAVIGKSDKPPINLPASFLKCWQTGKDYDPKTI